MNTITSNKELATVCHLTSKSYNQYCIYCGVRGWEPMTEREFINIGKACHEEA